MTNDRWEYHVRHSEIPLTEEQLNAFGAQGWELAAAMPTAGHYIFKRITPTRPRSNEPESTPTSIGEPENPAAE